MRKILVMVMVGALVLGLTGVAFSECYYSWDDEGDPNSFLSDLKAMEWGEMFPSYIRPPEEYMGDDGEPMIVDNGETVYDELCQPIVYVSKDTSWSRYCNPPICPGESPFTFTMDFEVYVHQWAWVYVRYTDWYWEVWKPGWYATDTCWWIIRSNAPFYINFSGFSDTLTRVGGPAHVPAGAPDLGFDEIDFYADLGTVAEPDHPHNWKGEPFADIKPPNQAHAGRYNTTWRIDETYNDGGWSRIWIPGAFWVVKWWFYVHVDAYNEPGTYTGAGTITVTGSV